MKKSLAVACAALLLAGATAAQADVQFVNGGFENGLLDGWTITGQNPGSVTVSGNGLSSYYGGYGGYVAAVTNAGTDSNVGIKTTYNGAHAARIGDATPWWGSPYQNNSLSQTATVTGSSAGHLYFAWAAVLEKSYHDYYSTPYFQVLVKDNTSGNTIYDVKHYEKDGGFWNSNYGWQYSAGNNQSYPGWMIEDINLDSVGVNVGDDLTLTVLSHDCDPTGHAMYVYLDGFGAAPPPPPSVPEPSTVILLGAGLAGLGLVRKRFKK